MSPVHDVVACNRFLEITDHKKSDSATVMFDSRLSILFNSCSFLLKFNFFGCWVYLALRKFLSVYIFKD